MYTPTIHPSVSWPRRILLVFLTFILLLTTLQTTRLQTTPTTAPPASALSGDLSQLPLSFVPNLGQVDPAVHFQVHSTGGVFLFANSEVVASLPAQGKSRMTSSALWGESTQTRDSQPEPGSSSIVRMRFEGANPVPEIAGAEPLPGFVNYFIGNDPAKWRTSIPTYGQVTYKAVYPGVDLIFYGNQRQLEYDFIVAPGADPRTISLSFEGTDKVEVGAQGDLVLHVAGGQIRQRKPLIYQEVDRSRLEISGGYVLQDNRVSFQVGVYDISHPLIIDPVLVYSTYFGGSCGEYPWDLALDANRNVYVIGSGCSSNMPSMNPFQPTYGGGDWDIIMLKVNPSGSALVYATFLGGSADDKGYGIAVDAAGNAYVTGYTASTNFPTTVDALQAALNGGSDAFVVKLNPTGSALVYSSYLGASNGEVGFDIAVDRFGNIYLAGGTDSYNFPVVNAVQSAFYGWSAVFVVKLNAAGSALVYSTFLTGNSGSFGRAIAVDADGNAWVTGFTASYNSDFPTTPNALQRTWGGGSSSDAFVAKLNFDGSTLTLGYSTYLGGAGTDDGIDVAVDTFGNAYVTGWTDSTDFPTANPLQPALAGGFDTFVAKFNPAGSMLVYSTYLGGSGDEGAYGRARIAVDAFGNAYVTGQTNSIDFPTVNPVQSAYAGGNEDVYVAKLNTAGSTLLYSTYLGGSRDDGGTGIAVDSSGNVYVTGYTYSWYDFPIVNALQPNSTGADAFIAKFAITPQTQIEFLINDVEDLVEQGLLDRHQGDALIAKLEAAIQSLNRGQTNAACNQLRAFINQVNAFVLSGVLSSGQGQLLIDIVNEIRGEIGC